jgi:20S proteasome alpha/beta subunit
MIRIRAYNRLLWSLLSAASLFLATASAATAASSYESVRALDEYGNAVQLQHARAAASRLVLAIQRSSDTVWVVYYPTTIAPHIRRSDSNTPISTADTADTHSLTTSSSTSPLQFTHASSRTALAFSGVHADARWLLEQLQRHQAEAWERYNHVIGSNNNSSKSDDTTAIAQSVARLKRTFWNLEPKWHGPAWSAPQRPWSRPMGVCTLVLSNKQIQTVEPSGIVSRERTFGCIGRKSDQLKVVLAEKLQSVEQLNDDELEQVLLDVLLTHAANAKSIVIEILSKDGVRQVRQLPFP